MSRTLKLNVEHRWFELMVTAQKNREFRKPSDWIKSRLLNKEYDLIEIRSGYGKHRPYFIAEYKGFVENKETLYVGYASKNNVGGIMLTIEPKDFIINIGKIKEIGNYEIQPRMGRRPVH